MDVSYLVACSIGDDGDVVTLGSLLFEVEVVDWKTYRLWRSWTKVEKGSVSFGRLSCIPLGLVDVAGQLAPP